MRLPIQDAKAIADKRGLRQVILLAWDGVRSHVVTYGKSIEDCDQAAQGGERMKKIMGWPNWEAKPSRVKALEAQLERANRIIGWMTPYVGTMCPPPNGLSDLNLHCCENKVPEPDSSTKGRPLKQSKHADVMK